MDAFTPRQTAELVCRIGAKKREMRLDKLFVNSLMTGPLVGFGCAVFLSTEAAPWFQTNAPGLIRTISATFFPIALVMVVLSGADLITTNFMFMTVAFLQRRVGILDVLKIWIITFFGNLAGSLFFVSIILGYGGVFQTEVYKTAVLQFATRKAVEPQWHQIMLRAIGANWLVCFAVFCSISARELASKVIAIWLPTLTFVALGLNHVVADMTFIPIAIWNGHPKITTGYYIWKAMIPTLIGNIIGGCLFVGTAYWYLYLTGDMGGHVDFSVGPINTAMEAGGPMRDPEYPSGAFQDGTLNSSIGKELSFEKYGKRRVKSASSPSPEKTNSNDNSLA